MAKDEQEVTGSNDGPPVASSGDAVAATPAPRRVVSTEDLLESVVRVTLAGFGAALVGLASERRQHQSSQTKRLVGPPRRVASFQQQNLPLVWAFSGMLFVTMLETCRLASPTTALYQAFLEEESNNSKDDAKETLPTNRYFHTAVVSLGDYALGGSVAGIAGALGSRGRASASLTGVRPPSMAWGLGTGLALGCLAGSLQAGIGVTSLYLERLQQQEEEEEARRRESELEEQDDR